MNTAQEELMVLHCMKCMRDESSFVKGALSGGWLVWSDSDIEVSSSRYAAAKTGASFCRELLCFSLWTVGQIIFVEVDAVSMRHGFVRCCDAA